MSQKLKDDLRHGRPTVGSWMCLGSPIVAEIMASAGFDWLVIDLEHTMTDLSAAEEMIRVVDLGGLPVLVRLSSADPVQIKRVLDAGAAGIVVPSVNSAALARDVVSWSHYPPQGTRGVGLGRAQGYGPGFAPYMAAAREHTVVVAQIEHVSAVDELDAILAVDGIDATMIGPYDLSASIGRPGEFEHPDVVALLDRYEVASKERGKPMGYHVIDPDASALKSRLDRGYSFVAFSTDFLFLGHACRSELGRLGDLQPDSSPTNR